MTGSYVSPWRDLWDPKLRDQDVTKNTSYMIGGFYFQIIEQLSYEDQKSKEINEKLFLTMQ